MNITHIRNLIGCDRSKDIGCDNFYSVLRKAPSVNVSKENLPDWLVARINDYYETWSPLSCNVNSSKLLEFLMSHRQVRKDLNVNNPVQAKRSSG